MNNIIILLINIYLLYKKIFWIITFGGLASWITVKLCWKNKLQYCNQFDYYLDNITHILFGAWIFLTLYILLFKLLLCTKRFKIRNQKFLISSIVFILIFTILFDISNEFTNSKSGKYMKKAYEHDLKNTYYDLVGSGIIIFIGLITSSRRGINYPNR